MDMDASGELAHLVCHTELVPIPQTFSGVNLTIPVPYMKKGRAATDQDVVNEQQCFPDLNFRKGEDKLGK